MYKRSNRRRVSFKDTPKVCKDCGNSVNSTTDGRCNGCYVVNRDKRNEKFCEYQGADGFCPFCSGDFHQN